MNHVLLCAAEKLPGREREMALFIDFLSGLTVQLGVFVSREVTRGKKEVKNRRLLFVVVAALSWRYLD